MSTKVNDTLPILRAEDIDLQPTLKPWLIRFVWSYTGVGIIGGAPKCCKSWMGLDMAVSVATNTPCLGQFKVENPGPALVYLAEDALASVRTRLASLCASRGRKLSELDLHVITSPSLRLDLEIDQRRLCNTIEALKPKILVLDPLVRLHRLDENSAADISKLLGFVREIQRTYDVAIVLVHHASKKHHAQPGQALRGSTDLHAFGDSNIYLARRNGKLILTLEHRSAKPPDPFEINLVTESGGAFLKVAPSMTVNHKATLEDKIMTLLRAEDGPMARNAIRETLKVNNQRLGETLQELEGSGQAIKTGKGWTIVGQPSGEKDAKEKSVPRPSQQSLPFEIPLSNRTTEVASVP